MQSSSLARLCVAATALLLSTISTFAADEPGSSDHPLIGRYQGSQIVFYKVVDYDEIALLQAPHDYAALLERNDTKDRSGDEWLKVEGRVTKIRYEVPTGRSSLEVIRNYENAIRQRGFQVLFACADQRCFEGKLKDPYLLGEQLDTDNNVSTLYFDHARYLLARVAGPQGVVYVGILTGEDKQQTTAFITVLESKAMEDDKIVFMDAGEMDTEITTHGKVNLYGIRFEFDKDKVRPESKPTLDEIAKLLKEKPNLNVEIVGHTDNRGSPEYNQDLSRRRAANVVESLVRENGISPRRMTSSGAGLSAPVAPNDSEEGRAKNRRVELVAK